MYYLKAIVMISLIVIAGCNDAANRSNAIKRFIPGTYVKEVKNEFMIARDTLIIQRTVGDNYLLVSRTAYQRIINNSLSPQRYSEVNMQAVYNDKAENLYEQRLGKTYSFDPENERLFEGASEYKKLEP